MTLHRWASAITATALLLIGAAPSVWAQARNDADAPALEPQAFEVKVTYDPKRLRQTRVELPTGAYERFEHPDALGSTDDLGWPALPLDEIRVLLPPDAVNVRIDFKAADRQIVTRGVRVEPKQPDMQTRTPAYETNGSPIDDFFEVPPFTLDDEAYDTDVPYPPFVAQLNEVGHRYGARIASIRVAPLLFYAHLEQVELRQSIAGTVHFDSAMAPRALYPDLRPARRDALAKAVVNPEILDPAPIGAGAAAGFGPKATYVVPDVRPAGHDDVPYVIITSNALAATFQPLIDWKTRKGVDARLVTVEWIETRYAGVDRINKLRNFILDALSKWGTSWILIGGDTNQVPARLGFYDSHTSSYGPTDLYLAGHDNHWNADGDHVFGEGGEYDLNPDIFVGRAPVEDIAEATTFVSKVLGYEISPPAGFGSTALLMGVRDNL